MDLVNTLSVVDVWVPMLWRWTAFELNHSVGGNWALKELIWHWDLLVFLNSLDSSDSFSGKHNQQLSFPSRTPGLNPDSM